MTAQLSKALTAGATTCGNAGDGEERCPKTPLPPSLPGDSGGGEGSGLNVLVAVLADVAAAAAAAAVVVSANGMPLAAAAAAEARAAPGALSAVVLQRRDVALPRLPLIPMLRTTGSVPRLPTAGGQRRFLAAADDDDDYSAA